MGHIKLSRNDIKFWAVIIVLLIIGVTMLSITISAISDEVSKMEAELQRRADEKAELMERVKNDCKLVQKVIGRASYDVTYLCDDGIEYTFTEWL